MTKLQKIFNEALTNALPPAIVQQHPITQTNNQLNQQSINNSYILIATIWGEARGEGETGMHAVLNVILNRAKGKIENAGKTALRPKQFSFWNKIPQTNRLEYATNLSKTIKNPKDIEMYNKAIELVDKANKGQLKDITEGALFYFNPKLVNPTWANKMEKTISIGNHDFYKLIPKTKSSMIKESSYVKNDMNNEYTDIRDEMYQEFHEGQKYQSWKLVSSKELLILWATFTKYGRIDENKLDKIWEIIKENVLKICINTDIWQGSDTDFFNKENYDEITRKEHERFSYFISDRSNNKWIHNTGEVEGNARYSDQSKRLLELLEKCYSSQTPEELLLSIDTILNFVHGLGSMAKWFVEGGVSTLTKISEFKPEGIHLKGRLSEENTNKNKLVFVKTMKQATDEFLSNKKSRIYGGGRPDNREIKDVYDINCGMCEEWSERVREIYKHITGKDDVEVLDVGNLTGNPDDTIKYNHVFIKFMGKFYDVECQEGVSNWKQLPIFIKRQNISENQQNHKIIVGLIFNDDSVVSSDRINNHEELLQKFPRGYRQVKAWWRYNVTNHIVYWWYLLPLPTEDDKESVDDYLKKKYNVEVDHHEYIVGVENDVNVYKNQYDKSHGRLAETDYRVDNRSIPLDYITGLINDDGEILSSNCATTHQILINWHPNQQWRMTDKKWRIHLDDRVVRWWEDPTTIEKQLVADFLKKWYNLKIKENQLYVESENRIINEYTGDGKSFSETDIKKRFGLTEEAISNLSIEEFSNMFLYAYVSIFDIDKESIQITKMENIPPKGHLSFCYLFYQIKVNILYKAHKYAILNRFQFNKTYNISQNSKHPTNKIKRYVDKFSIKDKNPSYNFQSAIWDGDWSNPHLFTGIGMTGGENIGGKIYRIHSIGDEVQKIKDLIDKHNTGNNDEDPSEDPIIPTPDTKRKLSLVHETNNDTTNKKQDTDLGYIGIIKPNQDILGQKGRNVFHIDHSQIFGYGGCWIGWRFNCNTKKLFWNQVPNEEQKMLVHDWLEKRGYTVVRDIDFSQDIDENKEFDGEKLKWIDKNFQAILTDNPVKLWFIKPQENTHVEIIQRLFPDDMEYLVGQYENAGYCNDPNNEDDGNDALYEAANYLARIKKLVRVVIENNTLIFNTYMSEELSSKQLKYLKDYCIENRLELCHSMGMKKKYIELQENFIIPPIKNMIDELVDGCLKKRFGNLTEIKKDFSGVDLSKYIDKDRLFQSDYYLDEMAEKLGYDIDFNKLFWNHPAHTLYHCTTKENYDNIIKDGKIKRMDGSRGLSNGHIGNAVFTTQESLEVSFFQHYYGNIVLEIDAGQMKKDGYTPNVEREPDWDRAEKLAFVLNQLEGDERNEKEAGQFVDSSDQNTQGTVIIYGDIPIKYVTLSETDFSTL